MVTLIKEQAAETKAEVKPAQCAEPELRAASWAPVGQAAHQDSGLVGRFVGLLATVDQMLAGPGMTEQQRTRREVALYNAERERRLSLYL